MQPAAGPSLLFRRLLLLPRPQPRQRHRVDDQDRSVREAGGKVHDGKGVEYPEEGDTGRCDSSD